MSKSRFQFGVRGLLVLTLAIACFLGGWIAIDRMYRTEAEFLRQEVEFYQMMNKEILRASEKHASEYTDRASKAEAENIRLKQKIGVLEYIVEQQKGEIEEINAVMDRPPQS